MSDLEQRDDGRAALVRAGESTAIAATADAAAAYVLAQSLASGGWF